MQRRFSMLVVLLAVVVTSLYAADVTGKWTAQVAGRDGQTREQSFAFKVDGEKLTGTISGMPGGADSEIKDGMVKGDDISFNVVRSFQGQEFTSWRDGSEGQSREFTAKRVTS